MRRQDFFLCLDRLNRGAQAKTWVLRHSNAIFAPFRGISVQDMTRQSTEIGLTLVETLWLNELPVWVRGAVSSAVEHCLHTAGVTGSKPVSPTMRIEGLPALGNPFFFAGRFAHFSERARISERISSAKAPFTDTNVPLSRRCVDARDELWRSRRFESTTTAPRARRRAWLRHVLPAVDLDHLAGHVA